MANVRALSRRRKKKYREIADRISVFGWPPGLADDYSLHVGLILNLPRVLMRHAVAHTRGARMAMAGQLPFDYFDALAASEEEAQKRQFEYNLASTIASAKSQRAF